MCSGCSAGKNEYSAGITGALLRGDVFGANRGYVVSHCAPPPQSNDIISEPSLLANRILQQVMTVEIYFIVVFTFTVLACDSWNVSITVHGIHVPYIYCNVMFVIYWYDNWDYLNLLYHNDIYYNFLNINLYEIVQL